MSKTKERRANSEQRNQTPPKRAADVSDDSAVDAALVQLLDLDPAGAKRLIAKAVMSGRCGRFASLRAVLRKLLFDLALKLHETPAIRGVTNLQDMR